MSTARYRTIQASEVAADAKATGYLASAWRDNPAALYEMRRYVVKQADETRTSTSTLAIDAELNIVIDPGEWWVEYRIVVLLQIAETFKHKIVIDTSVSPTVGVAGEITVRDATASPPAMLPFGGDPYQLVNQSITWPFPGSGNKGILFLDAFVRNNSTDARALEFWWAQGASSAYATTVYKGSWVTAHRMDTL